MAAAAKTTEELTFLRNTKRSSSHRRRDATFVRNRCCLLIQATARLLLTITMIGIMVRRDETCATHFFHLDEEFTGCAGEFTPRRDASPDLDPFASYSSFEFGGASVRGDCVRITKHEKSHIVELEDGSAWRIWPGDLARTLHWMPSSRLAVSEIDHDHCTHVLVDLLHGTYVRVIEAESAWTPEKIEASLVSRGDKFPAAC